GLRYGLDLLRAGGLQTRVIRLIGGGSKSPVWRQIVADIMDAPVVCTEQPEAAALGAAIQAAWCAGQDPQGLAPLCERCVRLDETSRTQPIPANVSAYHGAYQRYRQHIPA
ncbi:MAG: xylulokinase, partial [Moraxellaceae bacterium]